MPKIHTLNARSYIMLECIQDLYGLNTAEMRKEIADLHSATVDALRAKGVVYTELKSALVPKSDKFEAAFLFDSTRIESAWYGPPVFHSFIPLLDRNTTQSIRVGDLHGDGHQQLIRSIIDESLVGREQIEFAHSSDIYCLYVNNLSKSKIDSIHNELLGFPAYCGFLPTTEKPAARIFLSTTLMSFFLKRKQTIITSHAIDFPEDKNASTAGYPFEKYEYEHISIREDYFETFLSYKIERPNPSGSTFDTEMALSSVSDNYIPIEACSISIEPSKLKYLQENKAGSLKRAELADLSIDELRSAITDKITSNYIYNMEFNADHDTIKFDILLEFQGRGSIPARLIAAFEYQPEERMIRLITLF